MTLSEFQLTQLMMPDSELIELAEKEISKLAETGGRSHRMTVPPKATDTDMIFSELVRRLKGRPAADQTGAAEVLDKICKSVPYKWGENIEESELLLPKKLALRAMTTYAALKVAEAVEAKEKEMAELKAYYKLNNDKLSYIINRLESELAESKRRVAELEASVRPEVVLPKVAEYNDMKDNDYDFAQRQGMLDAIHEIRRLNPGINFIEQGKTEGK